MKILLSLLMILAVMNAGASWYWPFGSDDKEQEKEKPRLSTLMEPASILIDEASDLAVDGKVQEAVEKYRKALVELDRIEAEDPERAASMEFATVRNKRAYVNAAIDSLLLSQVQQNARAVSVSDTTELERKLAAERTGKKDEASAGFKTNSTETASVEGGSKDDESEKTAEKEHSDEKEESTASAETSVSKGKESSPAKPAVPAKSQREQALSDIASGDYDSAMLVIEAMLIEKPNSAAALNLKAKIESARGRPEAAEAALDLAIMSNPRSYHAYYNMAYLMLEKSPPNRTGAKRYYETGRTMGGPANADLEEKLK